MSVLNEVLKWKQYKDQEQSASMNAIPQAVAAFISGRQQAQDNQLKMLSVRAELAGKGFSLDENGNIRRDEALQSPWETLIQKAKGAEAAKSVGDRATYNAILGNVPQQQAPAQPMDVTQQAIDSTPSGVAGMVAPEIDPFTNKETTLGVQQAARNKQIEQKMTQEQKLAVPTAKQKEDFDKISAAEVNVANLEKDVDKLPSGYSGILSNIWGVVTRGANNPDLKTYNDSRPAIAVGLYRTLTGDTRLSDDDAKKRALPLIWDSSESKSVQKKKFENIKQMITARKEKIRNGQYTTTADGEFVTPLGSLVSSGESSVKMVTISNGKETRTVTEEEARKLGAL
jgi:hypothetical protein